MSSLILGTMLSVESIRLVSFILEKEDLKLREVPWMCKGQSPGGILRLCQVLIWLSGNLQPAPSFSQAASLDEMSLFPF